MKSLGRIFLFLLVSLNLYSAQLEVSNTKVVLGESVKFEITANGNDIEFPKIDLIGTDSVGVLGNSINTQNINGKITNLRSRTYIFTPSKDVVIPSFLVKADGKKEYTKEVEIKIISQEELKKQLPFSLNLTTSEKNPYVGEPFEVTMTLKVSERVKLGDIRVESPKFENCTLREKPIQDTSRENGYIVYKLKYLLTPNMEGNHHIKSGAIALMIRNSRHESFGMFNAGFDQKIIKSNSLDIEAKPLPQNVKLIGDFTITTKVDKTEVQAGKPVNVQIQIQGKGNLDDIDSFNTDISDVIAYQDKPKIQNLGTNNAKWVQKIAYIGSSDFTIPSFELKYFDKNENKVKTIKTEQILIKVTGSVHKSTEKSSEIIEPKEKIKEKTVTKTIHKNNYSLISIAFFIGIILGFLISKLKFKSKDKFKIFKNQKQLLQDLLPYKGKDEVLDMWIEKIEKNIYENKKEKINQKEIRELLRKLG